MLTIHDFWMFCFRGQLVCTDDRLCEGPSAQGCLGCARHLFKEWMTPAQVEDWRRQMHDVAGHFDLCLAPSRTVASFFHQQGVPEARVLLSPYGFDVGRIVPRRDPRAAGPVRFGFLGRVIPVKGVAMLLKAFHATTGEATLDIWGNPNGHTAWLTELCGSDKRVHLRGGYHNGQVQEALDGMDVLVAPSLWLENSPLVIQEAFLAGVPVITSDAGGMAELVRHGRDGFLTPLGAVDGLRALLQRVIDQPDVLSTLAPERSRVRSIEDDAAGCLALYDKLSSSRRAPALPLRPAPRRVTFVTNPGLCNLRCPMCDTHSPHGTTDVRALPVLDVAVVERVVTELAQRGLQEILPSTMGEPLLYPDFDRVLDLAARTGVRVNLTTNGTFPGRGVEAWPLRIGPRGVLARDEVVAAQPTSPFGAEAVDLAFTVAVWAHARLVPVGHGTRSQAFRRRIVDRTAPDRQQANRRQSLRSRQPCVAIDT